MCAYLDSVLKNSPALPKTALELHQAGRIPPNTWVVDLDQIAANAKALSGKAEELGLQTYIMSKQHNRNPYINGVAQQMGLGKIVAVDSQGALASERYGIPLGHIGHLNQIPKGQIERMLGMDPEVWTVYSEEHARWIDRAAGKAGKKQKILIRVYDRENGDVLFDGQEAGIDLSALEDFARQTRNMKNIQIAGVTAFPCLHYNESAGEGQRLMPNSRTLLKAAGILRDMGFPIEQINAPGNTYTENMALLKDLGATHVEPGNGILGTTPSHAFRDDLPEKTAFVYVTEVSHYFDNRAYALGGGVYHTNYSDRIDALVGSDWEEARRNRIEYHHHVVQDIDYHMQLLPEDRDRCRIGDSVIFAYRTQMHMTRSYVAPVSGISGARPLKLHYLFDHAVNAMDENFNPIPPESVKEDMRKLLESY